MKLAELRAFCQICDANGLREVSVHVEFDATQRGWRQAASHEVTEQIAKVRRLSPGEPAISPSRFSDLVTPEDYRRVADEVREATSGIPIGFKLSAQHIEPDLDFALAASADYVILDGRGGGTGAAPVIFKDNISVPTVVALARARRHLDRLGRRDVTLIITGGLRTESDFAKALALGADGIAIANSALQAIGCLGSALSVDDLTTWNRDVAQLIGVPYAGVGSP